MKVRKNIKLIYKLIILLAIICLYVLFVFKESKSETYDAQLITKEPLHGGIKCFDVNDDGDVLVASQLSVNKSAIFVYDNDLRFRFCLKYRSMDEIAAIEWENQDIRVYHTKGTSVLFSSQGKCLEHYDKYESNMSNEEISELNAYIKGLKQRKSLTVGDNKYQLNNEISIWGLLTKNKSTLTLADISGSERCVYKVSFLYRLILLPIVLIAVLFIAVFVFKFSKELKKCSTYRQQS